MKIDFMSTITFWAQNEYFRNYVLWGLLFVWNNYFTESDCVNHLTSQFLRINGTYSWSMTHDLVRTRFSVSLSNKEPSILFKIKLGPRLVTKFMAKSGRKHIIIRLSPIVHFNEISNSIQKWLDDHCWWSYAGDHWPLISWLFQLE